VVIPGNVLLEEGEANLPKQSVAVVSQLFTVDKEDLMERIGSLSAERIRQILQGIFLLLEPRDLEE
jgi:mRNA interferase MazF